MKFRKIFGIITSSILTIISIYSVIPSNWDIKIFISNLIQTHPLAKIIALISIAVFCILTIGILIYDLYKEIHVHDLKYGSKKFYRFFKKWYSKKGVLSIICEDIDWVVSEDGQNKEIFNALMKKAKRQMLDIYIHKLSRNGYEKILFDAGAKIYQAPQSLVNSYSFSSLSRMNNNSCIIVRKKSEEQNHVVFKDINNLYVTELLNVLLETSKEEFDEFVTK